MTQSLYSFFKHKLFALLLISFAGINATDVQLTGNPYKRYDLAVYGSFTTIGRNVNLQCELDGGYRFLNHCALSLSFNIQRRNGLLCSNDFITFSGVTQVRQLLLKGGITGGIYTIRSGNFREISPAAGAELVAAYILNKHLSIRLKERAVALFVDDNRVMSTSTLLGFGILF